MCGIAGICHINGREGVSLDSLKNMVGILNHRGPDGAGIYIDSHVGLGHTRLSIIDLLSGQQPIHNEDETMWIIYNGEVYNYPELKMDLLKKGHHFYTSSDTEVILHLYEEEGPNCLDNLNGHFAFAIWDSVEKTLFLARDRMGIKPLHYTMKNNMLIFSSEIKSIFMYRDITREIDSIAVDQIFTFWTTLSGYTVFKNIQELPPGHYLRIFKGQVTVKKYWEIPFCSCEGYVRLSLDEISERIRELLTDAVRIRLRANVPVGICLSGGLDSSVLTAITASNLGGDVRTFGIGFEEKIFDETECQNDMVLFLKSNHSEIKATNKEIAALFPQVLWQIENPLLSMAPVPMFLLSKLVRESGFKVVLSGEGADEIFGGYNIFREAKIRRFWAKQPNSKVRADLINRLYPYIFSTLRSKYMLPSFFAKELDKTEDLVFSHLIRWDSTSKIKTFFSEKMKAEVGSYNACGQVRKNLPGVYKQWHYLSQAQYLEMTIFLSNYLLSSQSDRVAMGHSVEVRLPYLDYRLINFVCRIPPKWRILGLNDKYVLRKSFQGILPANIASRPKCPYRAPIIQSLLNKRSMQYVYEMLSERLLKETGMFDSYKVKKLLEKLQLFNRPSEIDSMALVGILSSQIIYYRFIKNFSEKPAFHISSNLIVDRRTEAQKY